MSRPLSETTGWHGFFLGQVQVNDEEIIIPSALVDGMYGAILDRRPQLPGSTNASLQIWTGAGRTGTQFTIEVWSLATSDPPPVPDAQGTVVLVQHEGLVSFHAADIGTTVYASYTGDGSALTKWDIGRFADASTASRSYRAKTLGPAIAKGTFVKVVQAINGVPGIQKAQSDVPSTMPASGIASEDIAANGTGVIVMGGELDGLAGLDVGESLYVGTDGLVAQDGDGNMPGAGDILQDAGVALLATMGMIDLSRRITQL